MVTVWNFQLYMLPCALLLIFAWNAVIEYRSGLLGKSFATLGDEVNSIDWKKEMKTNDQSLF